MWDSQVKHPLVSHCLEYHIVSQPLGFCSSHFHPHILQKSYSHYSRKKCCIYFSQIRVTLYMLVHQIRIMFIYFYFLEYKLVAFISHMGTSTLVGHYVCHILKEGRWVIYNDSKVALSEHPPKDLAYLYLYQRISN